MRHYKKSDNPKQHHNRVSQEKLDTVLHLLKNSTSIRGAAKKVQIPVSTLRYIIKKNNANISSIENVERLTMKPVGKPRVLPEEDENTLATAISLRAKWGFGLNRCDIQDLVRDFVDLHKESDTPLGAHLRKNCTFKVSNSVTYNLPIFMS